MAINHQTSGSEGRDEAPDESERLREQATEIEIEIATEIEIEPQRALDAEVSSNTKCAMRTPINAKLVWIYPRRSFAGQAGVDTSTAINTELLRRLSFLIGAKKVINPPASQPVRVELSLNFPIRVG